MEAEPVAAADLSALQLVINTTTGQGAVLGVPVRRVADDVKEWVRAVERFVAAQRDQLRPRAVLGVVQAYSEVR